MVYWNPTEGECKMCGRTSEDGLTKIDGDKILGGGYVRRGTHLCGLCFSNIERAGGMKWK